MPLAFTMASKPAASVLSPKRVPSGRRRTVLTLPMAPAASVSSSQTAARVVL